jgi:hypothetical protein
MCHGSLKKPGDVDWDQVTHLQGRVAGGALQRRNPAAASPHVEKRPVTVLITAHRARNPSGNLAIELCSDHAAPLSPARSQIVAATCRTLPVTRERMGRARVSSACGLWRRATKPALDYLKLRMESTSRKARTRNSMEGKTHRAQHKEPSGIEDLLRPLIDSLINPATSRSSLTVRDGRGAWRHGANCSTNGFRLLAEAQ